MVCKKACYGILLLASISSIGAMPSAEQFDLAIYENLNSMYSTELSNESMSPEELLAADKFYNDSRESLYGKIEDRYSLFTQDSNKVEYQIDAIYPCLATPIVYSRQGNVLDEEDLTALNNKDSITIAVPQGTIAVSPIAGKVESVSDNQITLSDRDKCCITLDGIDIDSNIKEGMQLDQKDYLGLVNERDNGWYTIDILFEIDTNVVNPLDYLKQ